MKKIILGILITVVVLGLSGVATAGMLIPANEKADGKARITTPNLEKVVFIHWKKGFAKPPWAGGDKKEKGTKCYAFLGRGVEWKELSIDYVIHPDLETTVSGAIFAGAESWNDATSQELFSDDYILDPTANWDDDVPDGRNEFSFGDYPQEGVIGVAIVWGYFSGPPSTREIIEFDVLFDTDFDWGDASVDQTVMDLQNIATHEIGHGLGLADLYDTVCAEETMYGYSGNGEIKKRDLEAGDITGIQNLYGN